MAAIDNFCTAVVTETSAPLNIIQAIIAAVMQLISTCNPTPAPAEVKAGSMRWNIAVYRGMLMSGMRPLSAQGKTILASFQKNAATLADTDAAEFLGECGGSVDAVK